MATKSSYTVPQSGIKEIYRIACTEWKAKLSSLVEGVNFLSSDDITLRTPNIQEMFEAATQDQKLVLDRVFAEYVKDSDNNAFPTQISVADETYLTRFCTGAFDNGLALQVAESSPITLGRRDLVRKSLYLQNSYKVILHKTSGGGTLLEFIKK